jgi:ribose transport system permease protein
MSAIPVNESPSRIPRAVASLKNAQRDAPVAQLLLLLVLFLAGTLTISGFAASYSLRSMLVLASLLGISALGQTVCLLVGGLDISIPGWILVGATVTVELLGGGTTTWPTWLVLLMLFGGAILIGGAVGLISYYFHVPSLIVTLGVGGILEGVIIAWTGGNVTGVPPEAISSLTSIGSTTFGISLPPVVFIWALIAVGAYLVLQRSVIGSWIYATGNNRRAAELALVPTQWVWAGAFALSALSAVGAGVLLSGFSAGGDPSVGTPYLWNGVTAVLIGGTAFGTRGDYTRTVIGTLIVIVLSQAMTGWGFQPAAEDILYGALIILVVSIYRRDRRLQDQI